MSLRLATFILPLLALRTTADNFLLKHSLERAKKELAKTAALTDRGFHISELHQAAFNHTKAKKKSLEETEELGGRAIEIGSLQLGLSTRSLASHRKQDTASLNRLEELHKNLVLALLRSQKLLLSTSLFEVKSVHQAKRRQALAMCRVLRFSLRDPKVLADRAAISRLVERADYAWNQLESILGKLG